MALDAIVLSGIIAELSPKLCRARIDKLQQPERDKIILSVRGGSENMRILIDAGAGSGRLQQTKLSFENPPEPPMFCMLLRKYLVGGRIERIEQPDWERLAMVYITSRNELGDNVELRLAVELMGRSSNLVLIGSDGRIIDCLRRMDYGGDAERRMLPGMIYRLPPKQRKPLIFDMSEDEIRAALASGDCGKSADKRIMDAFSGLSPLVCRELACRAGDDPTLLPEVIAAADQGAVFDGARNVHREADHRPPASQQLPLPPGPLLPGLQHFHQRYFHGFLLHKIVHTSYTVFPRL